MRRVQTAGPPKSAPVRKRPAGRRAMCYSIAAVFLPMFVPPLGSSPATEVLALFGNGEFDDRVDLFAAQAAAAGRKTEALCRAEKATSRFYRDDTLPEGADRASRLGVETANFVYYIGHGGRNDWDSFLNGRVKIKDLQLGDDHLRYLWLVSCHTMAHGPSPDRPYAFRPGSNEWDDVFSRWGRTYSHDQVTTTPLTGRLRLACGGSTELEIPTLESVVGLWEAIASGGPPSDTFLNAFEVDGQVPLCITRGGAATRSTPLYDTSFIEDENDHGTGGFLYIQYPVRVAVPPSRGVARALAFLVAGEDASISAGDALPPRLEPGRPPRRAPVLELQPRPELPELIPAFLDREATEPLGFRRLPLDRVFQILASAGAAAELEDPAAVGYEDWARARSLYLHPCSGGRFHRGPAAPPRTLEELPVPEDVRLPELQPRALIELRLLRERADARLPPERLKRRAISPRRVDMYIDRAPQALDDGRTFGVRLERFVKHHRFEVATAVEVPRFGRRARLYPVIGEGGTASLEVGPDGSLLSASLEGRRITGCRLCEWGQRLRSEPSARREAKRQAARSEGRFREPTLTWGYLEAPATCYQREMGIVYRYNFEPLEGERVGTLVVDVPAHGGVEPWLCIGEQGNQATEWVLPEGCEPGGP